MNEPSTCIWNAKGVCGFDISQPGRQVLCYPAGCKDYEPKITAADLKKEEVHNAWPFISEQGAMGQKGTVSRPEGSSCPLLVP